MNSQAQWTVLVAHPHTAGEGVYGIAAEVRFIKPAVLFCDYTLHADMRQVRMPESHGGGPAEGLWRHTCFEAFIGSADSPGYYEFNFSPGRDWAVYRFQGYRDGMSPATPAQAPALQVYRGAERVELSATVALAGLPELADAPLLRVALAAVVEDDAGELSYWALRHAAGKPDFHHRDGFALELSAP